MASRSRESESINLISSMYFDDDDEMEDVEHEEPPNDDVKDIIDDDDSFNIKNEERVVDSINESSPPASIDDSGPDPALRSRPVTPQQHPQLSLSSPQEKGPADSGTVRGGRLTIVDYGHDEVTMSPEAEEGEIVATGVVRVGAQLLTVKDQEKTPSGAAHILSPSSQATTPVHDQLDVAESQAMNFSVNEPESTGIEEPVKDFADGFKDANPLDRFLPPPPKAKCSDELQDRINKFLYLKRLGKSYNAEVRNKKEYRNPDFLLHTVTYKDIDEIGSGIDKDVFDPHGCDKSDFYDEIEADMKREMERKEQEKKKSQKVDFISGGTQPGVVAPSPKINIPIPGASTAAAGGLRSVSAAVDSVARDGRQNKKSKWDKVDGDQRTMAPSGGHDSVSAAMLTAANAGTGYTAFAQQRRREAEEKRYSEKRADRRS